MAIENVAERTNVVPIEVNKSNDHLQKQLDGEISRLAFDLYEAGGSRDGDDLSHWYRAESQILLDVPKIQESASWYSVNVPIYEVQPEDIYVEVDANRAVIALEKPAIAVPRRADYNGEPKASLFLVAHWNAEVDPATASAYVKNGNLTLSVKQVRPA